MDRDVDTNQKRGKAAKAKLDSKGRPIAEPAPEQDKREDEQKPVRVAVRLGAFLLALSTQSGCERLADKPDPLPAVAETGAEQIVAAADVEAGAAVEDARAAAALARASSEQAHQSAVSASKSAEQCLALLKLAQPSKFGSAHGATR